MQTTVCGNFRFHHYSGLTGEVTIINDTTAEEFKIDGESLVEFVAEWVRNYKISELENMSDRKVLGLKKKRR